MRTMLRGVLVGAAVAAGVFLGGTNLDHPQPLTTAAAVHRVDLSDSSTEGDARLIGENGRLGAYVGAFASCSEALGGLPAGLVWVPCLPARASLVDAGGDVALGA